MLIPRDVKMSIKRPRAALFICETQVYALEVRQGLKLEI